MTDARAEREARFLMAQAEQAVRSQLDQLLEAEAARINCRAEADARAVRSTTCSARVRTRTTRKTRKKTRRTRTRGTKRTRRTRSICGLRVKNLVCFLQQHPDGANWVGQETLLKLCDLADSYDPEDVSALRKTYCK